MHTYPNQTVSAQQKRQHLLAAALNPAQLLGWHTTLAHYKHSGLVLHATRSGQLPLVFEYTQPEVTTWQALEQWLEDCNDTLCARVSRSTALGL